MSILVTGGAGYIGSHMVHALVDSGESVAVLTTCPPVSNGRYHAALPSSSARPATMLWFPA